MNKINIKDYKPDIESIWERLYIGPIGEVNRLIDEFNSRYSTDIGITKALSWKRGSYDKVRSLVSRLADGFDKRPKDMNHLFDLRLNNAWKLNSIKSAISAIQQRVWQCRYNGIKMDKEQAINYFESKKEKLNFNENIIKALDKDSNIEISILQNATTNDSIKDDTLEIKVWLNNINMKVYRNGEFGEEVLAEFPMGNVMIKFTYNVFSFINNTSSARIMAMIIANDNVRSHPFLKETHRGTVDRYGTGYCMGDFDSNIHKAIKDIDLGAIVLLCREWLSNYKLGYTNPLNRPDKWFFGYPEDLPQEYSLIYSGGVSDCSGQIIADISKENIKDLFGTDIANDYGWRSRYRISTNSCTNVLKRYISLNLYEFSSYEKEFYSETSGHDIPLKNDSEIKTLIDDISVNITNTCKKSKCKFRHGQCKLNYNARYASNNLLDSEIESEKIKVTSIETIYNLLLNDVITPVEKKGLRYIQDDLDDKYGCYDEIPLEIRESLNIYTDIFNSILNQLDVVNLNESEDTFKAREQYIKQTLYRGINNQGSNFDLTDYLDRLNDSIERLNEYIPLFVETLSDENIEKSKPLTNKEKLSLKYKDIIPNFDNLSEIQRNNAIATIINSNNPF